MKDYKHYTADVRRRALAYYKDQLAKGLRPRPSKCMVCGQDHGVIDGHSERYDEPFGPHIGEFTLCFSCHLAWHGRRRDHAAWTAYNDMLNFGLRLKPFATRNLMLLNKFMAELKGKHFDIMAALPFVEPGQDNADHGFLVLLRAGR